MENSIERIKWIDVAKGIGIILVIIGHVSINANINNFIYSFHMPLFFIISGFLYKPKKNFVKNKAKSILIPYFVFSIISFIYWLFIERFFRNQQNSPLNLFFNIFLARGGDDNYLFNVVMWFLPCLFLTEILFDFLVNRVKYKYVKYIIITSSIIGFIFSRISNVRLPFCFDICFSAIVFFYVGFYLKNKVKDKMNLPKKNILYYIILIMLFFSVVILSKLEHGANMNNLSYKYYSIFYITAIIGFYMIYMISNKINIKCLKWIGSNSLYIMVIHEPLKRIIVAIYAKMIDKNPDLVRGEFIHILIISLLVLILTSILAVLVNHIKDKIVKKYKIKKQV